MHTYMHTIVVILGGLVLLVLGLVFARATGRPVRAVLPAYLLVWLICAGVNMWIGVSRAGYSVAQEFPIFLVIFAVPAVIAVLLARRT